MDILASLYKTHQVHKNQVVLCQNTVERTTRKARQAAAGLGRDFNAIAPDILAVSGIGGKHRAILVAQARETFFRVNLALHVVRVFPRDRPVEWGYAQ